MRGLPSMLSKVVGGLLSSFKRGVDSGFNYRDAMMKVRIYVAMKQMLKCL